MQIVWKILQVKKLSQSPYPPISQKLAVQEEMLSIKWFEIDLKCMSNLTILKSHLATSPPPESPLHVSGTCPLPCLASATWPRAQIWSPVSFHTSLQQQHIWRRKALNYLPPRACMSPPGRCWGRPGWWSPRSSSVCPQSPAPTSYNQQMLML